ncbi:MAG: phosphatidylserine decarboxylase family protein [Proteobacteria bacterium]|nr:phosphatidylserine decarboxylase family protein [Pseudomonadota bacterium]MBU1738754.1 phosphatidylserine decarboxylase family protein [Pseudomonadota bacterium]
MKEPSIPVAREGYPFIAFTALLAIVFAILGYTLVSFSFLTLTAFVLYFFRDPERVTSDEEDSIISPADGKIILIEKVFDDNFVKEHVYKISIFMNVFNVHVNRTPFSGKVKRIVYSPGTFYSASSERSSLENESCAVILETESGKNLAFVQIAGLIARRIVCWAEKGDELVKGERFGMIRFGSRVDLYLPQQTQLEVVKGQKVVAGETVLGYLP